MQNNLLEIENLSVIFKNKENTNKVVDCVSLSIESGEILGLVGESGSGKSQLSLACLGLNHDKASISGSIKICSEEIIGKEKASVQTMLGSKIAMIFQNPMTSLNPFYKIGDQLCDMLLSDSNINRNDCLETLKIAFEDVSLKEPEKVLEKYPHQFSGGQLQRIMIALAISCKTKVLIADEPTTALDVTTQHQIVKLLRRLVDKYSMSLLFISHDLGVVFQLADRIAVMQNGAIIEQNYSNQLLKDAQNTYTKLLINSVPLFLGSQPRPSKTESKIESAKQNILSVSKVSKVFISDKEKKHVLKDVDFELSTGDSLAIVGESGSGKTTLAMILVQLIEQSSGRIFFDGHIISAKEANVLKNARQNICVVFQNPYSSLNPRMRIFDSIAEPLKELTDLSNDAIRKKVESIITEVGLEKSHLNRFPHEFSGGQRQRIAIARAYVLEPKLIIFDEPTAALDVTTQAKVIDLLNDLRGRTNTSYLFITHNLAIVEQIANKVLVLYGGAVVENGLVRDVFTNPSHEYTKELIESVPTFEKHNNHSEK